MLMNMKMRWLAAWSTIN